MKNTLDFALDCSYLFVLISREDADYDWDWQVEKANCTTRLVDLLQEETEMECVHLSFI